jgi:hypothetical protein
MPTDVRRALLRALRADASVRAREEELIDERFAGMSPLASDGTFTTNQTANARGFARKTLARELGLWVDESPEPDSESAEPLEHAAVEAVVRPRRRGRRRTYVELKAIADRGVAAATELLEAEGWAVRDVGGTHSYDLHCEHPDGRTLYVEVKGTTGPLVNIVLTANEVELARVQHPHTALYVVYGITLTGEPDDPEATGGTIHELTPWRPEDSHLKATVFSYWL